MNRRTSSLEVDRRARTATIRRTGTAAVLLVLAGVVLLGSGGGSVPPGQGVSDKSTAAASASFRPGELLVKFKPNWRPPAAQLYRRRQSFAPYTGSSHLDTLHQRYGVTEIRPLFPLAASAARRTAPDDTTAAEWNAQVHSVRKRYARRARRAPVHADVPDLSTIYKLTVPEDTDIQQLAAEYAADPSVEYAEPNYEYHLFFTPNDPFFTSSGSWGQKFPDLWGVHNIQAEQAWDLSTGAGVIVAVIDTGLADHPDIHDNIWTNPVEIPDNGIDDDGNGYIDDVHGWLFLPEIGPSKGPTELFDGIGHGTHVAGTIAAAGNNGQGIVGVAWQAKVMPLGIFEETFGTTTSDASAGALAYAVQNGADIVNMSFGGPGDSFLVRDAIDYAAAHGLVLVAAAGNDSIDASTQYPARYDPVIAVAAVDHLDQPSFFSNFGGKIELAAPGGGDTGPRSIFEPFDSVLSLAAGGDCSNDAFRACVLDARRELPAPVSNGTAFLLRLAGTSMAAPHVSATAALILSRHPEFTVEQVRQALRDGADDLGPPGRDARYGYGRLNAAQSVALDEVAVARLTAPRQLSRFHGELITVEGTVQNPDGPAPTWQLLFGPQGQALNQIATGIGAVDHGELASIDTGPLDRGNYLLRLEVTAANGAQATDTVTFTRLASGPYLRQISDFAAGLGGVTLGTNAWSDDGRTLVWAEQTALTFQRVVAMDLATGSEREIAAFRLGREGPLASAFPTVGSAISGDGNTVAVAGPEDLSTSNTDTRNRNFQLFLFDMPTGSRQQVSHAGGGTITDFQGLTITTDGGRVAFLSALDLDPAVGNADGNPEVFYWDRANSRFHQVTRTSGQLDVSVPAMSADGSTIAVPSRADLDPTVGNSQQQLQLFVYNVPTGRIRQLTSLGFFSNHVVEGYLAISHDGRQLAVWVDTLNPSQRTLTLVDAVTGSTTDLVTTVAPSGGFSNVVAFSSDDQRLVFATDSPPDPLLYDPKRWPHPPHELFEYDRGSGAVRQLTAFGNEPFLGALAVEPGGKIAITGSPADKAKVDPEGDNADRSGELYLLDPAVGGGSLKLSSGMISQGAPADRMTLKGLLVQPTGPPLDATTNGASLTVLSGNGQLFRATVPAGRMTKTATGWRYANAAAADLTQLRLRTTDNVHYTFSATGHAAGLALAATPYVTVEIQVGQAIFSNAQAFRQRGRRLKYP